MDEEDDELLETDAEDSEEIDSDDTEGLLETVFYKG